MHTSFAPHAFGAGRWEGGPAVITNPHFQYRDADFGRGPEKLVALSLVYLDAEGGEHPARFDVGNTQTQAGEHILVIRASADDGADEAETGPSFSHIDPDRVYKVSPRSEFGVFLTNLVGVAGFSEAKLESGDITVLDGLQVVVTPRAKKEGDKFPLLLVTELQNAKPAAKATSPSKSSPAGKKPTAAAAVAAPADEEAEELDPITEAARDFVLAQDKPLKIAKAVTLAMAEFKGDKKKSAAVVGLIQKADFHEQFTDYWSYDAKTKTINEAE